MEQYKLSQLISSYEFVVGVMKVIENKTIDAFVNAVTDYKKIKNTIVEKSSVRMKINGTEYSINISKKSEQATVEDLFDSKEMEEDLLQYQDSDWEKNLSDNITKKLLIHHYLNKK